MSDEKYFAQAKKKGELEEIKNDLNSDKKERKREGVKRLLAAMTLGKDVASLFPDVLNCMQTDDLELKKLVYVYLQSYAKNRPDIAILAINTFIKDCDDSSPLVRALAIRTMGCMLVENVTDYLCEPLRKCITDKDPYVRKTAAVCILKLYIANPTVAEEQGFLQLLWELLDDSNSMVVANAAAALCEIASTFSPENQDQDLLKLDFPTVSKLLIALSECSEWSQSYILDYISRYTPESEEEIKAITERIMPRLSHTNSAIVLSAIRIMLKYMNISTSAGYGLSIANKIAPPLVTMLSSEPEIQYVALRNISVITQRYPEVLKREINIFFVKYNDPLYVKLEKLDNMIRLVSQDNISHVLSELNQYAMEVDVDFVRKSVRAIGRCAIKLETAASQCVKTLVSLIETKINYVIQEAVVVMRDIFRKYPNTYEGVVSMLCENLEDLDEPDSRGAFIWIIGEYANRITNAWDLLEGFIETFTEEQPKVQLQLLTAVVKAFLYRPTEGSELLQKVLSLSSTETDNPDLRDRSIFYWRMLSRDPVLAKDIVLAEKPPIMDETDIIEPILLSELMAHLGNLACVYHKPPQFFLDAKKFTFSSISTPGFDMKSAMKGTDVVETIMVPNQDVSVVLTNSNEDFLVGDLLGLDTSASNQQIVIEEIVPIADISATSTDLLNDVLDDSFLVSSDDTSPSTQLGLLVETASSSASTTNNIAFDLLSLSLQPTSSVVFPKEVWLEPQMSKGLQISGTFSRKNRQIYMHFTIANKGMQAMTGFAIQFNLNIFGLVPAEPLTLRSPVFPQIPVNVDLPLATTGRMVKNQPIDCLQVAIKNNEGIFYFNCSIPLHVLCMEDGKVDRQTFSSLWGEISQTPKLQKQLDTLPALTIENISQLFEGNNIFTVYLEKSGVGENLYQSMKLANGVCVLLELRRVGNMPRWELTVVSKIADFLPLVCNMYEKLLVFSSHEFTI